MEKTGMTIRDMVNYADKIFNLKLNVDPFEYKNIENKISTELKKHRVPSIGKKKVGKTQANVYDSKILDTVIYDWSLNYFKQKSQSNEGKNMMSNEELKEFLIDQKKALNRAQEDLIENHEYIYNEPFVSNEEIKHKKIEIMIEALFNKYFVLDEEKLIYDMTNNLYSIEVFDNDLSREIITSKDNLKNNENYYTEK